MVASMVDCWVEMKVEKMAAMKLGDLVAQMAAQMAENWVEMKAEQRVDY